MTSGPPYLDHPQEPFLAPKLTGTTFGRCRKRAWHFGPVVPSFRALSGRPKFTVRRHKIKEMFSLCARPFASEEATAQTGVRTLVCNARPKSSLSCLVEEYHASRRSQGTPTQSHTPRKPLCGGIPCSFLEPFRGHLSPNIDNVSEKLTLRFPHKGPWVVTKYEKNIRSTAGRLSTQGSSWGYFKSQF